MPAPVLEPKKETSPNQKEKKSSEKQKKGDKFMEYQTISNQESRNNDFIENLPSLGAQSHVPQQS